MSLERSLFFNRVGFQQDITFATITLICGIRYLYGDFISIVLTLWQGMSIINERIGKIEEISPWAARSGAW
jgi:hypothetical protein